MNAQHYDAGDAGIVGIVGGCYRAKRLVWAEGKYNSKSSDVSFAVA